MAMASGIIGEEKNSGDFEFFREYHETWARGEDIEKEECVYIRGISIALRMN